MSDIASANVPASTVTLLASAARTTTASATAIPGFAAAAKLVLQLNVTAASGTAPTLDVVVQDNRGWHKLQHHCNFCSNIGSNKGSYQTFNTIYR